MAQPVPPSGHKNEKKLDMIRKLLVLTLCAFLPSLPVQASDPVWFPCSISKGVALQDGAEASLSLGALGDMDGKSYLLLQGAVTVPSLGYSYLFINKGSQGELILKGPEDMAGAVISSLSIQERFENKTAQQNYVIKIKKDFNWGPEEFTCAM